MIEILKEFWDKLICDHNWEVTFIETLPEGRMFHYICLNCGKTKEIYTK